MAPGWNIGRSLAAKKPPFVWPLAVWKKIWLGRTSRRPTHGMTIGIFALFAFPITNDPKNWKCPMPTNLFPRIKRERAKSEVAVVAKDGKAGRGPGMGKTPYSDRKISQLIVRIMRDKIMTQAGEPAGALPPCEASSLRRILVVDDEPDIRRINAMVLHRAGYHVDTAEDGASGWSELKPSRYDVLITDNTMPRVTGLELIKKLRSEEMPLTGILPSGAAPAGG